jgi:hypothetical protein
MSRIIGSNSHGVKNELNIVNALKNKYFSMLNNNLKEFIKFIASENNILIDHNTIIDAEYEPNNLLKQDFYIIIDRDYAISCKMGNGNSVHQEKCEDFIKYIKEELFASDDICDKFRFFIWSDGTLDGSGSKEIDEYGNIKSRFTAIEFRERYPEKSRILQNFLDKNEEVLIRRFLFVGRHNSKIDYIYHGNEFDGYWVSANDIMKANMGENKHIKGLHVGKMSLQSWNISKKGNTEHKRGQLQVKYPQMKNDLYAIMRTSAININTFFGDKEEYNLSREFNKNNKICCLG